MLEDCLRACVWRSEDPEVSWCASTCDHAVQGLYVDVSDRLTKSMELRCLLIDDNEKNDNSRHF